MPNHSKDSRSVLLIQYLPKFIRPMEDQKRMLKKNVGIPLWVYLVKYTYIEVELLHYVLIVTVTISHILLNKKIRSKFNL